MSDHDATDEEATPEGEGEDEAVDVGPEDFDWYSIDEEEGVDVDLGDGGDEQSLPGNESRELGDGVLHLGSGNSRPIMPLSGVGTSPGPDRDPDDTEPKPAPEPTADTEDDVPLLADIQDEEDVDDGVMPVRYPDTIGLAKNGLTNNETITIVGMTVMSFTLAYGILLQMTIHGFHHAPVLLWFAFAFLLLLPIGVLYGMGALHILLGAALSIRDEQQHDTEGEE